MFNPHTKIKSNEQKHYVALHIKLVSMNNYGILTILIIYCECYSLINNVSIKICGWIFEEGREWQRHRLCHLQPVTILLSTLENYFSSVLIKKREVKFKVGVFR